ncbi:class I SAM-dependent methyltransferase [soil metagenome]
MSETILVFPGGLPEALHFRAEAEARGAKVVGASSLKFDPAASAYKTWTLLPYAHRDDFAADLEAVLKEHQIDAVFSPHEVVSGVLVELLAKIAPAVRLISANPVMAQEQVYIELMARARRGDGADWFQMDGAKPALSVIERAGLLRLVDSIPGMTDLDKIAAVIETMRYAPPGDVVEIGSWWGRSAALMLLLARRYQVGPVLCVDPWSLDFIDQGVAVLDQASRRLDMDIALRVFEINLSPIAGGQLNYIRAPSTKGAELYRPGLTVTTEAFGETRYSGDIAFLHIDGNHTFDAVSADAAAWTPKVRPGGWIVFDDYVWAFGDGPKRVGDAFLESQADRIEVSFVIGTALFIRLADR